MGHATPANDAPYGGVPLNQIAMTSGPNSNDFRPRTAAVSIVVQYARHHCTCRLGRLPLTGRLLPQQASGLREARTVGGAAAPD